MASLGDWLACPNGCDVGLDIESWAYGFRAECQGCGEVLFWET